MLAPAARAVGLSLALVLLACNSDLGFFSAGARQTLGVLREGIGGGGGGDPEAPGVHV